MKITFIPKLIVNVYRKLHHKIICKRTKLLMLLNLYSESPTHKSNYFYCQICSQFEVCIYDVMFINYSIRAWMKMVPWL